MAMSVLSQASALNPGADLWILPDTDHSTWTAKLDWYLNFQINKALNRTQPVLSTFTEEIIGQTGLKPIATQVTKSAPLMIASQALLPNKWVVILNWQNNSEQPWTENCFKIWSQLKEPTVRFFLPPGQSAGAFQRMWKSHHSYEDFSVVLD